MLAVAVVGACVTLSACVTLEQMAPPIDTALVSYAGGKGFERADLELGRRIYIKDCAACHSPEPIARYSLHSWREILPRMCEETNLTEAEERAVNAYVMSVSSMLSDNRPVAAK